MKLALIQVDATVGDVGGNAKAVIEGARRARGLGADLAIAPELVVPGYPPRDLLLVSSFRTAVDRATQKIAQESPPDLALLFGTLGRSPNGRGLQNVAALARNGRIEARFAKTLLPTYDVFDERRYFEPNPSPRDNVFELVPGKKRSRVGVTICEDAWNDAELWGAERRYTIDPVEEVVAAGARVVVNLSASPFASGKWRTRRKMLAHAARRHRVAVAYVNTVGGNDGLVFDGGSAVFGGDGLSRGEAYSFAEDVYLSDLRGPSVDLVDRHDLDDVRSAIVLGVRDYFRKVGARDAVVGLSGGIDSALVATLAVEALGAEHVTGVAMPSQYSSDHSIADARELARRLGIRFHLSPIADILRGYRSETKELLDAASASAVSVALASSMPSTPGASPSTTPAPPPMSRDIVEENLQSRIRGAILMAFSNKTGAFVLTTGNKSEAAVGYCTLYGDTCGGLAVIADLFKVEVYALCRRINETAAASGKEPPIPDSTMTKPPSAELRPGQIDQDDLPPYEVLDRILEALIEKELGVEAAAEAAGEPIELVRSIARRVRNNEYKRQQFPPTIRVSDRAWVGRAYPIAQRWDE